jgi:hypothetical protein
VLLVTNGTAYLDQPVTFRLRSLLTESKFLAHTNSEVRSAGDVGIIVGQAVHRDDHTSVLGGGIQFFSYVAPVLPSLSVGRLGTNILTKWSTNAVGLMLQSNSEITNVTGWNSVTNTPATMGSNYVVEVPVAAGTRFFRLTTTNVP